MVDDAVFVVEFDDVDGSSRCGGSSAAVSAIAWLDILGSRR